MPFREEVSKLFCKELESECLRLSELCVFCCHYLTLSSGHENCHRQ